MWTRLKTWSPLALGLVLAVFLVIDVTVGSDAGKGEPDPVAQVDGRPIAWKDLQAQVAADLQRLEIERQRVLEAGLDALLAERLLEAEAARRKVSVDDLLRSEVTEKTAAVTEAEVDAWYTQNQVRIRQPKEQVAEQIRSFLSQQRQQTTRDEFLASLRERFDVVSHLAPFRIALETEGAPTKGPESAPVTLVEFSDFQCPYCAQINPTLQELQQRYGEKLQVVFRQFPLRQIHPEAQKAAEAALCAEDQGKFWPMHDALFSNQQQLAEDNLRAKAEELGLDMKRFERCLDSDAKAEAVQKDLEAGERAGVAGTPAIYVNGRPVQLQSGTPFADQLAEVIDDELRRAGS